LAFRFNHRNWGSKVVKNSVKDRQGASTKSESVAQSSWLSGYFPNKGFIGPKQYKSKHWHPTLHWIYPQYLCVREHNAAVALKQCEDSLSFFSNLFDRERHNKRGNTSTGSGNINLKTILICIKQLALWLNCWKDSNLISCLNGYFCSRNDHWSEMWFQQLQHSFIGLQRTEKKVLYGFAKIL